MTPTQRTLAWCRKQGGLVAVVERWNPHVKIRQDLFGFADLLWVKGNYTTLIQVTSADNSAKRISKIKAEPRAAEWASSFTRRIEVHGWSKKGAAGKRKLWTLRRQRMEFALGVWMEVEEVKPCQHSRTKLQIDPAGDQNWNECQDCGQEVGK